MSAWSDEFSDVLLAKSPPEASYRRWSALERRGIGGLLRAFSPRQAYVSGFEIGVRAALAILDEVREFSASGTLTEGGDVEQAPSDSLSGPTGNAGDAQ